MSTTSLYGLKKQGLEDEKMQQALNMLLIDRLNEFRELSTVLLRTRQYSDPIPNPEQFVLNFCLEVDEAFRTWTGQMILMNNSPQKAINILRQLSREKTTMNQLTHFLNMSYTLAAEFKEIYRRLK
ncbi:MAG: hypothetical protein JHC41_01835 [Nitrosopumilus sp.]|jgi:5-bromo-4-chloroindolyl phosphate hydrolysis protein|nr:hypothetical protein [Nitrosopumilus sp.]